MEQEVYQKIKASFDEISKENQELKNKISTLKEEKKELNELITDLIRQIDIEKVDVFALRENLIKEYFSADEINSLLLQIDKINSFLLEQKEKGFIQTTQKKMAKTTDNFQKIKVFKDFLKEIKDKKFSCSYEFEFIENADMDLLNKEIDFLIEKMNNLTVLKKEFSVDFLNGSAQIKDFLARLSKLL